MNLRDVGAVAGLVSVIGGALYAYVWLDEKHADRHHQAVIELEIKQEILDRDIKKDAEAVVYYRDLESERGLSKAEAARKEYLEGQLDRKYEDQQMLQEAEQRMREK